jgi:hypothetical protein
MATDGISPSRAQVVGGAFLLIVTFAIPQVSSAFFIDGSQLAQSMREYDKAAANAPGVDWKQANEFTAYVAGAYDTLELADLICKPPEMTRRQLNAVVAKYLKEVPESWHRPAAILISEALRKAFPCSG